MKFILLRKFVFTAIVSGCLTFAVDGQTRQSDERPDIVVIDQPDSPMRLVPAPTSTAPYMLRYSNVGDRAVRAFVLVTEHAPFDSIQTHWMGQPFEPGKDTNSNFGPANHTRLYFDYVLYADGTSWGSDKFERSKEIAHFYEARATVIERLTFFAAVYPDAKDFLQRIDQFGSTTSYDTFGPPKPQKLEEHARIAWDQVIRELRYNPRRAKEAAEIADPLEKDRPT